MTVTPEIIERINLHEKDQDAHQEIVNAVINKWFKDPVAMSNALDKHLDYFAQKERVEWTGSDPEPISRTDEFWAMMNLARDEIKALGVKNDVLPDHEANKAIMAASARAYVSPVYRDKNTADPAAELERVSNELHKESKKTYLVVLPDPVDPFEVYAPQVGTTPANLFKSWKDNHLKSLNADDLQDYAKMRRETHQNLEAILKSEELPTLEGTENTFDPF